MAQRRHTGTPHRGETQFTTMPSRGEADSASWVFGCIGCLALSIPLLLYAMLAVYSFSHGSSGTTSGTSNSGYSDIFPPSPPTPPRLYYASFQVNAAGGSGTTVLTVKDELIRMITVASASEIPKERIEAAARNDIVDGVRTTILKGKVTVTVATLEQHDEWVSLLLAEDGGLRQAFLRNTVEGTFPRPPPAVSKDWIEALSISQMMGISPRDHRPLIREVYIVGEVLALHTPTLLHESRSSINIVDLDLRLPEYDRFKYVNALAKYIEDSRRYKHRYDPHYSDTREEGGYGSEGGKGTDDSLPKDHPMESHPIEAVP